MCQPTHWSWHRGKEVCARKQVWCRLFPCWSNEEAIETLGVAIWLLTPFLLQCNCVLLPMGAELSVGPSSRSNPGPNLKTSGGRIVFCLELEEAAAKEKETGNQNTQSRRSHFCSTLYMCATICLSGLTQCADTTCPSTSIHI